MVEAPPWDPPIPEFSRQEESMFDYRGWLLGYNTSSRGQLFINSVTSYAYDAADVMDDDNYATVLEHFVDTLTLQVAQVNTKKKPGLDHLVLAE